MTPTTAPDDKLLSNFGLSGKEGWVGNGRDFVELDVEGNDDECEEDGDERGKTPSDEEWGGVDDAGVDVDDVEVMVVDDVEVGVDDGMNGEGLDVEEERELEEENVTAAEDCEDELTGVAESIVDDGSATELVSESATTLNVLGGAVNMVVDATVTVCAAVTVVVTTAVCT